MTSSPIADASLMELGDRVRRAFRLVQSRAPEDVSHRVESALGRLEDVVTQEDTSALERRGIARILETLDAELHGRDPDPFVLYAGGRLGVIRLWDPVQIRETIDDRRVREHLVRYVERANRAQRRLHWFFMRAGLETEAPPERPAWEQPYASFEEYMELLWRRLSSRFL
ncbi:MAG: hypothetical protein VX938_02180 [Myxococcota bacterium]|nr:hypothetical protein [Myxococcota bacterium]